MITLEKYQQKITGICQKYRVKRLSVFGSALTENFNESSDIDFLIELEGTMASEDAQAASRPPRPNRPGWKR
ncbi:MAG: nucleotidyltransferase family protein [Candidatus Electrothrix sp. YB6]